MCPLPSCRQGKAASALIGDRCKCNVPVYTACAYPKYFAQNIVEEYIQRQNMPKTCDCLNNSIPQLSKPGKTDVTTGPPSFGLRVVSNLHERHSLQN